MKKWITFLLALAGVLQASGPYFSIEYLYWKIREGQLYSVIASGPQVEDGIYPVNQKFEYTSGFRATAGYDFCYEQYDARLAWTRIRPRTTLSVVSLMPKNLIAISFFDQTNSDVPHAGAVVSHWHLNFDMLDFDLGRKFTIGKRFSIRPFIGLKGGWIYQTQRIVANDIILGQPPVELVTGTAKRQNDFHGLGPSVGTDIRFGFGQFGLFSSLSGALLYGDFHLKLTTFLPDTLTKNQPQMPGGGPSTTIIVNSDHFISPMVQMVLGGDWRRSFCRCYEVRLGAAYEVQFWWNQVRSNNSVPQLLFANSTAGGDLTIHGLTVQVGLGF